MRALITGSSGTVGTALRSSLTSQGWDIARWDRKAVSIDDYDAMERHVKDVAPDVLFHLAVASQPTQPRLGPNEAWRVDYEWTSELAWICRELGIRFVFTSTVMVFTEGKPGPYSISSRPDAAHDYGLHKREAEERIFHQNPKARIARLGWQIGDDLRGNQMAAWLDEHRHVKASTRWIPACSHLADTADALRRIAGGRPGLYHVDGNEGWSFYDIARALEARHGADWNIEPTSNRAYDQRLVDPRVAVPPLVERFPELAL